MVVIFSILFVGLACIIPIVIIILLFKLALRVSAPGKVAGLNNIFITSTIMCIISKPFYDWDYGKFFLVGFISTVVVGIILSIATNKKEVRL